MTLRELKNFIAKLPEEMDNFMVVNGEVGYLDPENEDSMVYRVDNPIVTLYVDEQTQEVCMFHQTREDVKEVLKNNNNGDT
jgi:phage regulator Rha-like protein